jgi:hypothetical protein
LTPHPNPHAFTPTAESLLLAVLLNAQAEHEGMTLAVFSQPEGGAVAVDALGRVLSVADKDSAGILDLARKALDLPETGTFRNTWIIKHAATSQPIDRIFIPSRSATSSDLATLDHLKQVSVQGFSKNTRELKTPLDGITDLPDTLWELAGLVLEAKEDSGDRERRDQVVLGKVRAVVGNLF